MKTDYWGVAERKLREYTNPWFASVRRMKLNRADFTVISNNCWAGSVYRYFGLPYLSPTAGLYFFASDYIKFIPINSSTPTFPFFRCFFGSWIVQKNNFDIIKFCNYFI